MPKKRPSPEQIVTLLRQIEFATSSGKPNEKLFMRSDGHP